MRCRWARCLLEEHSGAHWYGSPKRAPRAVDDLEAVRELRRNARAIALRLAREGAKLR